MPRATKWVFGSLLALDVLLLLIALASANVTAEEPSKRALARSVAILTEVDTYLDEHYAALQLEAQQSSESSISVPDFPVAVSFTPEEVATGDRAHFRDQLLARSAAVLRNEGMSTFREGRTGEIDSISPQGAVRTGLDLLRPTPHRVFVGLTTTFAVIAALLAVGLVLATRGYGRVTAVGVSLAAATAPFLIFAIALRFALRIAADGTDDYVTREFLQLAQELDWASIRNGIIFLAGANLLVIGGPLLGKWSASRAVQ